MRHRIKLKSSVGAPVPVPVPVLWVWIFWPNTIRGSSPIVGGAALVTLYTDSWNLNTWTARRGSKHSSAPVPKSVQLRKTPRILAQGPIPVANPLSPSRYSTTNPNVTLPAQRALTRNLVLRRNNFQSKQAASVVGRDLPGSRPTHLLPGSWVVVHKWGDQPPTCLDQLPRTMSTALFRLDIFSKKNYTFNLYYLGQFHFGQFDARGGGGGGGGGGQCEE